jgi:hypothetical protein
MECTQVQVRGDLKPNLVMIILMKNVKTMEVVEVGHQEKPQWSIKHNKAK